MTSYCMLCGGIVMKGGYVSSKNVREILEQKVMLCKNCVSYIDARRLIVKKREAEKDDELESEMRRQRIEEEFEAEADNLTEGQMADALYGERYIDIE